MKAQAVLPAGWPRPSGYAHGMLGEGKLLVCAGQMGVREDRELAGPDLVSQFDQALANVCQVVRAAGGAPADIVRLTIYLTDMQSYRSKRAELGQVWKARMGRHYPSMSVVGVAELAKPQAVVEIEATALLGPSA